MEFSDVYKIMENKILIGKLSIECLNKQLMLNSYLLRIKLHENAIIKEKVKIVNELNSIFEKQMSNFDEVRNLETIDLYMEMNKLDDAPVEIQVLIKKSEEIAGEINHISQKIQFIESKIPAQKIVTNYKIKRNLGDEPCGRDKGV